MKRIMVLLGLLAAVSYAGIVVTMPPSSASTAPAAGATTLYGTNSWVVVEHGTQYVYQVVHTPTPANDETRIRVSYADNGGEYTEFPNIGDIWTLTAGSYESGGAWSMDPVADPAGWFVTPEAGNSSSVDETPIGYFYGDDWMLVFEYALVTNDVVTTNIFASATETQLAAHDVDTGAHADIRGQIVSGAGVTSIVNGAVSTHAAIASSPTVSGHAQHIGFTFENGMLYLQAPATCTGMVFRMSTAAGKAIDLPLWADNPASASDYPSRQTDFEGWTQVFETNYSKTVTGSTNLWFGSGVQYHNAPGVAPPGGSGYWMGLRSIAGAYFSSPPFDGGVGFIYFTSRLREIYHSGSVVVQVSTVDEPEEGDWETIAELVYPRVTTGNPPAIATPIRVNRTDVRRVRFLRTVASPIDDSMFKVDGAINFDNIDIVRKDSIAVTPR